MDKENVPLFSNHFSIHTNGQEFVFEFAYQEPQPTPTQSGDIKTFIKVALSRIGAEKFLNLLQMTLRRSDGEPPTSPTSRPRL